MAASPHIVIIGAGPAGAMLAYLLASRAGDAGRITLIERQRDFEREFRGEILMPSGIDAIRQAGLEAAFAAVPKLALVRARMFDRRRYVGTMELKDVLGEGFAFTAVSQSAMLEMLVAEASKFNNFRFERGVSFRDLVVENGRIRGVEISEKGDSRTIDADLVIGADGRASSVRRKAELEVIRRPQSFDIVWCKVPQPVPLDFQGASLYLGNRHFSLAFPTYDGTLQMAWVINKGAIGDLRKRGVEEWVEEMANHVTPDLATHLRANRDKITQPFLLDVICDLMPVWTKPGLLLIGDAAHPMSPVGGQGLNIAMRDAIVAANHLVPAIRHGGQHAVLDAAAAAMQRERMSEVKDIQRAQQLPPRLFFGNPVITRTMLTLVPLIIRVGFLRRVFIDTMRRFAFGQEKVKLTV
jgi:2-polyprenyl-6-methoxyphenol hydroxylase-like FAD-dependent oxidoreductase